jgi:hypothetical protein
LVAVLNPNGFVPRTSEQLEWLVTGSESDRRKAARHPQRRQGAPRRRRRNRLARLCRRLRIASAMVRPHAVNLMDQMLHRETACASRK